MSAKEAGIESFQVPAATFVGRRTYGRAGQGHWKLISSDLRLHASLTVSNPVMPNSRAHTVCKGCRKIHQYHCCSLAPS